MRRLAFILAVSILCTASARAQGTCPSGAPNPGNHCYFVAANGSDSNDGLSEASGHPWAHAPGMPSCSSNCATLQTSFGGAGNSAAGYGFIFRGNDVWHFGNSSATPYVGGTFNVIWSGNRATCVYEGTVTGCLYYGRDPTWYSGSSVGINRPVFDGDNPITTSTVGNCDYQIGSGNQMYYLGGGNSGVWTDGFEMRGMCAEDTPASGFNDAYAIDGGNGGAYENMWSNIYIHGWTASTSATTSIIVGNGFAGGANSSEDNWLNIVDGSDSNQQIWAASWLPTQNHLKDSVFTHVTQMVSGACHDIHDNTWSYWNAPLTGSNSHGNTLECNTDLNGPNPNVFYNNVVAHDQTNLIGRGEVHLWFCPENSAAEFWFNNTVYDIVNDNYWDIAGPNANPCGNQGGQFMFNNTLMDGVQPCYLSNITTGGSYLTVTNEHLINTPFDSTGSFPCTGVSSATNVAMSDATAVSQGYAKSGGQVQTDTCANDVTPCAPTASGNSTVAAGTNYQTYCTTLASYSSEYAIGTEAANACKYGTTDGCSYNSTTHVNTCPSQTPVARPATGPWDSGAYQWSSATGPVPAPAPQMFTIKLTEEKEYETYLAASLWPLLDSRVRPENSGIESASAAFAH